MPSALARRCWQAATRIPQASLAIAFAWLAGREPRGFDFGSREFFAHQVSFPVLALVALVATFTPTRWSRRATAFNWGFFLPPALLVLALTNMSALRMAGVGTALIALAVFGASEWTARETRSARRWAFGAGVLCGGLFVLLLRAPSDGTRPAFAPNQLSPLASSFAARHSELASAEPLFDAPAFRISVSNGLSIQSAGRSLWLNPAFRIDSASRHCLWSIIDYESETLSPWRVAKLGEQSWLMAAESASVASRVLVSVDHERVVVTMANTVSEELCVHLAQILTVSLEPTRFDSGRILVDGHSFRIGDRLDGELTLGLRSSSSERREALAWRHGQFALLRAASDEKGPFDTLALLANAAPVFVGGGFRFRATGFAEQASRDASPTAGWGVSQGAIEATDHSLIWELAATSLGRGWNTVRIAPGTYQLRLTIEPGNP